MTAAIGREHRLGARLWELVDIYRTWLAGTLDADAGLVPLLNELLGHVLGPAGSGSLSFIDDEIDRGVTIDVGGDAGVQAETLRGLGWPSYPPTSTLVGHILDRLEYDWALRLSELAEQSPHSSLPAPHHEPDYRGSDGDPHGAFDLDQHLWPTVGGVGPGSLL